MPQSDPSKTERATPKRRKKARGEGNVPKSQELSKSVLLIGGLLALYMSMGTNYRKMQQVMAWFFGPGISMEFNETTIYNLFIYASKALAVMLVPTFLFLALISYLVMRLQVGSLWSTKVLKPKFKFNIISCMSDQRGDMQLLN